MNHAKKMIFSGIFFPILVILLFIFMQSCATFRYKTYDEETNKNVEDPEPNYNATLDENFQNFTSYMFIGNRIENFGTYFNTYFNAKENFDNAYDDYATRVLSTYSEKLDSIFEKPSLSQETIDNFNKAIEKASKIIQLHKSSQFMDNSVLLVGKSYYYLGDYLKAERKFSEFISKLPASSLLGEAQLFLAKTQMRLDNIKPALDKLDELIAKSSDKNILSGAYQSKAEYFLNIKDYDNAIKNFKKAIEYSKDSEFKAQMQFLVATVTERTNKQKAASEFNKVLDYGVSFDLEYLARYNYTKSLIANNNFPAANKSLEDLEVRYKDNIPFLGEINYLKGVYYEQKKDFRKAISQYYLVIQNYPSTKPSSDASYRIAQYEENTKMDYLNAYRYYRFSIEQNSAGIYSPSANNKIKIFKRYYELRSVIAGTTINTDYDSVFKSKTSNVPLDKQNEQNIPGKEEGKPGGVSIKLLDSLLNEKQSEDSVSKRLQDVASAKFELAELFLYDLNMADSSEYYLNDAYQSSDNYDFRAKVMFALASLYRNKNEQAKSDEILKRIIDDFPSSSVTQASKRLLNISVDEENTTDAADSLYFESERKFLNKQYEFALSGFKQLIANFSTSKYIDKSLYAAGWIYENIYIKPDSAYVFYSALINSAPTSPLVSVVSPKIEEYNLINQKSSTDSNTIVDSLKINDSLKTNIPPPENIEQELNKEKEKQDNIEPTLDNPDMKKEGQEDPSGEQKQ